MLHDSGPKRTPKQARSGGRLFALEEISLNLLIQGGRSAVTPKALIEAYRAGGGKVSKQWVSDYMGNGEAIVRRLATGHFNVLARYAAEAGELAILSRDLEEAARILAHHVAGGQDPWFGQAHPALCGMVAMEGHRVQGHWVEAVVAAAGRILSHFQPRAPSASLATPAAYAVIGAWFGLVLEGRHRDENRLACLAGAFLGVARSL